jgi:hypothetical protein
MSTPVTPKERAILREKIEFVKQCVNLSSKMESAFVEALTLTKFWFDNDYETELTELDIENFRFTKEELSDFIGMLSQVTNFATGQAVDPVDYQSITNQIK